MKEMDRARRNIEEFEITEDCELRTFIESKRLTYKRGCAFYEFSHESEDISENREVLLRDIVSHTHA